jgi:hypothetical protein
MPTKREGGNETLTGASQLAETPANRTLSKLTETLAAQRDHALNPVGPKGSNQPDTEFHGVCGELRGAELIA